MGPLLPRFCILLAIHLAALVAASLYYGVSLRVGQETPVPVLSLCVTLGRKCLVDAVGYRVTCKEVLTVRDLPSSPSSWVICSTMPE